jgi:hypothetical protein
MMDIPEFMREAFERGSTNKNCDVDNCDYSNLNESDDVDPEHERYARLAAECTDDHQRAALYKRAYEILKQECGL